MAKPYNKSKLTFRSKLESSFAQYLDSRGVPYKYEPITFDIGGSTYKPDFYVVQEDCITFYEVKGMHRHASSGIRIFRIATSRYPEYKWVLVHPKRKKEGGGFKMIEYVDGHPAKGDFDDCG